jgi:hypothetical protein
MCEFKTRCRVIYIIHSFTAQCMAQLRFLAPCANLSINKEDLFLKESHKLTLIQIKLYDLVISYNKQGNSSAFRCLISIYRSIVYLKEEFRSEFDIYYLYA